MKEKINEILDSIIIDKSYVNSKNLILDEYLDSFEIVKLIHLLNSNFNVHINIKDIKQEHFATVDTIADFIKSYQ